MDHNHPLTPHIVLVIILVVLTAMGLPGGLKFMPESEQESLVDPCLLESVVCEDEEVGRK